MIEAMLDSLAQIFGCPCYGGVIPQNIVFLFVGVIFGLAMGLIPGLGGLVGMSILLPFTYTMEPTAGIAVMLGMLTGVNLGDSIPSILFSVPGSASSQATILDGHPMARKGEAGRAFGAAYMSSMVGGLIGAAVLFVSVPVMRPLVLMFGAPEFFMMGVVGIAMVGSLSGKSPIKGIVAGAFGLLLGAIGIESQSGSVRWDFGILYLWDGVPLVTVALGLFALPELIDMAISGGQIARTGHAIASVMEGIKDTFRHWFLVIRTSVLGVWVGLVPGLGAPVVDWFAYGHARQTEKGAAETFGKGDVRGVLAVEAAANAKEGGALIPTVAFGVPGSATMALLIAALTMQGIIPGPSMVQENLNLTYAMVLSLAIANVIATGLALGFAKHLAKLSTVPANVLLPLTLVITFLAAYQGTRHVGDLVALMLFAALGWTMKRARWPRPPIVLGIVLSGIIENYLFIAYRRYGWTWLWRPAVIALAVIAVASVWWASRATKKSDAALATFAEPEMERVE